jgi:DNA-binding CsgD family transcriptional regulator
MPLATRRSDINKPRVARRAARGVAAVPQVSYRRFLEEGALCVPACEEGRDHEVYRLTARELEVLRWTMEGKTAWETGAILGISEQTVVRHLGRVTHKLGCVNKVQAVVKAMRLGLVR